MPSDRTRTALLCAWTPSAGPSGGRPQPSSLPRSQIQKRDSSLCSAGRCPTGLPVARPSAHGHMCDLLACGCCTPRLLPLAPAHTPISFSKSCPISNLLSLLPTFPDLPRRHLRDLLCQAMLPHQSPASSAPPPRISVSDIPPGRHKVHSLYILILEAMTSYLQGVGGGGIKATDGIKVAHQLTLQWGDDLAIGGTQCDHRAPRM